MSFIFRNIPVSPLPCGICRRTAIDFLCLHSFTQRIEKFRRRHARLRNFQAMHSHPCHRSPLRLARPARPVPLLLSRRLMGRISGRIDGPDCMINLESQDSVQFALMSLLSRALVGSIDLPRANFALKLLNTAVRNARYSRFTRDADEMVTCIPNYADQYLTEHPEHADPARSAARKAAAAKGLATRRRNQAMREAKRVQRAAEREAQHNARKNSSGADTPVRETPTKAPADSSTQKLPKPQSST